MAEQAAQRRFREDLYYRLKGVGLFLSPLRERESEAPAAEVHYCGCADCTDMRGGALAILAVVDKSAVVEGREKTHTFDTQPTCHRIFCSHCGCHIFLNVDAFPDYTIVHVPALNYGSDVGEKPERWVFVDSRNEMMLPEDGLPKRSGWAASNG